MNPVATLVSYLTAPRRPIWLVLWAALIGISYVFLTFDSPFLSGTGPFWHDPRGPWLMDSADAQDSFDILDTIIGYTGFLHTPWTFPIFFVQKIGAPTGTNVAFTGMIPIVAIGGRIASWLAGAPLNPHGVWVGLCFVLSAALATLLVIEAGQRSWLAATAASLLAVSAPTLLHRFGHLGLMGHFVVIGSLYLYCRDRRPARFWFRTLAWGGWLSLALLMHPYFLPICAAVYGASLLRRWRLRRLPGGVAEPALILILLIAVMIIAGYVGPGTGTSPLSGGFGYFSMNLMSPFWPQWSGLFPGMHALIDATGGQYEGFNYLGFGALIMAMAAALLNIQALRAGIADHRELFVILLALTVFAISHRVFFGHVKIIDLDYSWRFDHLMSTFRSSGRMFWPAYYVIMLGGLVLLLRRLRPGWQLAVIPLCCVLQLIDSEPLRARLTVLTRSGPPMVLDEAVWSERIRQAKSVEIYPTYFCSIGRQQTMNMELQLFSVRSDLSFNSVYNPRLQIDCAAEATRLRAGPWQTDTLYVVLSGNADYLPAGWAPQGLDCRSFAQGIWCLGKSAKAIQ